MGKQRKDKIFPDIVIMRMKDKRIKKKGNVVKPVFLIELKEHSKYVSSSVKSDLRKLAKASKRWRHLQQSYFIYHIYFLQILFSSYYQLHPKIFHELLILL